MSNPTLSNRSIAETQSANDTESFSDLFSQYEKSHARNRNNKNEDSGKQLEGIVSPSPPTP